MLNENIKALRKSKGLSQEELAIKLNVVRQTISKWEQGLSVPDSEMLIAISEELNAPVSVLLGENVAVEKGDTLQEISNKLEIINLQLAGRQEKKRKTWHWIFISISILLILIFVAIAAMGDEYMEWIYDEPELAILGVGTHAFVWAYVRVAPIAFIGSIIGACLTRKKR